MFLFLYTEVFLGNKDNACYHSLSILLCCVLPRSFNPIERPFLSAHGTIPIQTQNFSARVSIHKKASQKASPELQFAPLYI